MNFVNCTPHAIVLNDGTTFEPSGIVPRVAASFTDFQDGVCRQVFGDVEGLPEPQPNTMYIVSALVLAAVGQSRPDVVAPATGHPQCVRENGLIKSVPGFVRP